MQTTFLNQLAKEGVILESYYTYYFCTPSRASLLTGRYSDQLGLQRTVLTATQPYGIPLRYKLISDHLKQVGYSTHAVGKWHVGYCNQRYTATERGFDSFLGFYNGGEENYKHCIDYMKNNSKGECIGFDFRKNKNIARQYDGEYSTHVYTDYATGIIRSWKNHHKPLFMYIALTDTHFPVQAPKQYLNRCENNVNNARKEFCGAMIAMDDSVKNITMALKEKKIYENSVIIVASDNGGSNSFGGNNFPLRGQKGTIYEGGIRVPAFVHSPLLQQKGYVNNKIIHVSDWYPTILKIAKAPKVQDLDGVDQWDTISMNKESARKFIPIQMDLHDNGSLTAGIRDHRYKLIAGSGGKINRIIPETETIDQSFNDAYLTEYQNPYQENFDFLDTATQLFDLEEDPSESHNLASEMPDKVKELTEQLETYKKKTKPYMNVKIDPKGNPENFNNVCSPGWCKVYIDTPQGPSD